MVSILGVTLFTCALEAGYAQQSEEYHVKAAFFCFTLLQLVEWPAESWATTKPS
jgi:hypothetical protein